MGGGRWFDPAVRAHRRDLRRARRDLRVATRAYQRVVTAAEGRVRAAEAARRSAIEAASARLRDLEDPRGQFIATYAGVEVRELFISTPTGSGPIEGVSAVVDAAGDLVVTQRATLTRMAAGGVALGGLGAILALGFPKGQVSDRRELYLVIEGPAVAHVAKLPAEDGHRARQFAAAINALSVTAAQIVAERPGEIDEARRQLLFLEADMTDVDRARAELETVRESSAEKAAQVRAADRLRGLEGGSDERPTGG